MWCAWATYSVYIVTLMCMCYIIICGVHVIPMWCTYDNHVHGDHWPCYIHAPNLTLFHFRHLWQILLFPYVHQLLECNDQPQQITSDDRLGGIWQHERYRNGFESVEGLSDQKFPSSRRRPHESLIVHGWLHCWHLDMLPADVNYKIKSYKMGLWADLKWA